MDAELLTIAARSAERLMAVLFGGVTIYFGYRLFLVVPVETLSDGRVRLPGISVVLAKAGPGLFFTAFGAIVLIVSFMRPVTHGGFTGMTPAAAIEPGVTPRPAAAGTPQQAARVQLAVNAINCMNRLATTGTKRLPAQDAEFASREAKLALLGTGWSDDWGDFHAFKQWATAGTPSPSASMKALFEAESPECPQ